MKLIRQGLALFAMWLVFAAMALLVSCAAKRYSQLVDDQTTEQFIRSQVLEQYLQRTRDSLLANLAFDLKVEITKWSEPDTSGRQYPVSTTTGTLTGGLSMEKNTATDVEASAEQRTEQTVTDERHTDRQTQTDVRTDILPRWVWWFLIVGGSLAALLYWVSNRRHQK